MAGLVETSIATFISAGMGAGVGTYLVYLIERQHRRAEERNRQCSAVRKALFALATQLNTLKLYQQDVIEPCRNDPLAWFKMESMDVGVRDKDQVDFDGLNFILGSKEGKLLFDLWLQDKRFQATVDVIRIWVSFMVNQFQPRMAQVAPKAQSLQELEQDLGEFLVGRAKSEQAAIVSHVDSTVAALAPIQEKLLRFAKDQFPGQKFTYASTEGVVKKATSPGST